MAMRTEPAPRLPLWAFVALGVAGIALGLWQLGAFDRSAPGERAATHVATAGQLDVAARPSPVVASRGESAANLARDSDSARSMLTADPAELAVDSGVQEETRALQEALAAEVANEN